MPISLFIWLLATGAITTIAGLARLVIDPRSEEPTGAGQQLEGGILSLALGAAGVVRCLVTEDGSMIPFSPYLSIILVALAMASVGLAVTGTWRRWSICLSIVVSPVASLIALAKPERRRAVRMLIEGLTCVLVLEILRVFLVWHGMVPLEFHGE